MKNLESYFPGLKVNLSVQAQGQYHSRTAVGQRGEQTLNKDAKTVGGIKRFSGDNNAVTKWTLGRLNQAKNLNALFRLCNMKQQPHEYRHNRPNQTLQSEQFTANVFDVLQNIYLNLFDPNLKNDVV